jgi:hypothetical protein
VARVALRAVVMPAIWASRISTGRPAARGWAAMRGGGFCGGLVEGEDAVVEVVFEGSGEGFFEGCSSTAVGQDFEAEADFEGGDRGCPDRVGGLVVEPGDDDWIGLVAHQGREDVGVEEDHPSRSAGRAGWPRSSGMSSSRPISEKRVWSLEPSGVRGLCSSLTALRRI